MTYPKVQINHYQNLELILSHGADEDVRHAFSATDSLISQRGDFGYWRTVIAFMASKLPYEGPLETLGGSLILASMKTAQSKRSISSGTKGKQNKSQDKFSRQR